MSNNIAQQVNEASQHDPLSFAKALDSIHSQHGRTLRSLSDERPTLVVFLRHSGCTFCREALEDLRQKRHSLEQKGTSLALVYLSPEASILPLIERYQLADVDRFADPDRLLYQAFELRRGSIWHLFGGPIFWRGFLAAIVHRHGFGMIAGDPAQMPGAFLLHHGRIVRSYRHRYSADRPDYEQLACPLDESR